MPKAPALESFDECLGVCGFTPFWLTQRVLSTHIIENKVASRDYDYGLNKKPLYTYLGRLGSRRMMVSAGLAGDGTSLYHPTMKERQSLAMIPIVSGSEGSSSVPKARNVCNSHSLRWYRLLSGSYTATTLGRTSARAPGFPALDRFFLICL